MKGCYVRWCSYITPLTGRCTWKRHLSVDGLLPCLFRLTRSHKLQPMRKMKVLEVHKGRGIKLRKRKRKRKNEDKRRMKLKQKHKVKQMREREFQESWN